MCRKCPPHCHWTYRLGAYVNPWYYPTREDAEQAASRPHDPRLVDPPEIYQVHADGCSCEREMENA